MSCTRLALHVAFATLLSPTMASLAVATELPRDAGVPWNHSAQEIRAACDRAIAPAQQAIERALHQPATDASATVRLETIEFALSTLMDDLVAPQLLADVSSDDAVREAALACRERVTALRITTTADPELFFLARKVAGHTSGDTRRLAEGWRDAARQAGAALNSRDRATARTLQRKLASLEQAYMQALGEDQPTLALDDEEVAALPAGLHAMLRTEAQGRRIPVSMTTYFPFMRSMPLRATRERYLAAYYRIGGEANRERLREAVRVRGQLAHLLGCRSWAICQIRTRMARTPDRARELVETVDRQLLPKARAEIATLAQLKREQGDSTPFTTADYPFYENLLEKTRYAVDSEAVRQYFPLDHFIAETLAIYADLLGVTFHERSDAAKWAPDVRVWLVTDRDYGRVLGWIYIDVLPRAGKSIRPSSFALRLGHRNGSAYRVPMAAIIGVGPAANPGEPTLLTHRDAVEFFHEFGHLMHMTLAHTQYASLQAAMVPVDFVEAPSQMLENWMWQPAVLRRVSHHVRSGEPLPDATIARLVAAQHVADGAFWTRQAALAMFDLQLHDTQPPRDPDVLWRELHERMTALPFPRDSWPSASFLPVMGGYDAGYYGYLWSRVYAQDMFSVFEAKGIADQSVGKRYRDIVLQPGAESESLEMVERFLGRPVRYEAFYRNVGITSAPAAEDRKAEH